MAAQIKAVVQNKAGQRKVSQGSASHDRARQRSARRGRKISGMTDKAWQLVEQCSAKLGSAAQSKVAQVKVGQGSVRQGGVEHGSPWKRKEEHGRAAQSKTGLQSVRQGRVA